MALRDTEDKLRRCPKRVRPAQVGGSLQGQVWQRSALPRSLGQSTKEIWPGLTLPLPAAPTVFLGAPPPPPRHTMSVRGGAGAKAGRSQSPIDQPKPVPRCPHPGLLSADAYPHSSIMDSTLSASSVTCRVSRKRGLAPPLPSCGSPGLGNGARQAQAGRLSPAIRRALGLARERAAVGAAVRCGIPGVSWPGTHRPPAASNFFILRDGRGPVRRLAWLRQWDRGRGH